MGASFSGWRTVAGRVASLAAAVVALSLLGVGARVAWEAFRPVTPPRALLAVASRGVEWQARLGVAGHSARASGLVQEGSQAAQFAQYLTARARGASGVTMLSSRLVALSVAKTAWTGTGGYVEFRVVDQRWFSLGASGAPVPETARGLVTVYVQEVKPGSLRVTGLAYLPALPGAGSRLAPSLYPDYFTSDGHNPLGG
ncbi:MAG: hypothetical protein M0Z54_03295 [Thermaerobacter sp.]|nr:hypothetical protein [Thermaerobacter sp.]